MTTPITQRFAGPRAARSRTTAPRHTLFLGLLFAAACASSETTAPVASDTSSTSTSSAADAARDASDADALAARRRPPARDYTEAELEALAQGPEVAALREPWANAPAPDRSFHVTMSDGTRLALSLYFPVGFDQARGKAPVAYIETWYGRRIEATGTAIDLYRAAGFVVAIADPRGFGASFGTQTTFLTDEVRRDQKEMIAWLSAQSWSNGQVAAVGISISSTQAEAMAASGAPALKAAILRSSDSDHYNANLFPGGLSNVRMLDLVNGVTELMRGEPCLADPAACPQWPIAPVDGDADYSLLRAAFQDHQSNVRG
ncbi:MAG TPA: CocE/NonD family hydrolase, partial [Polyangia bacterium]